MHDVDPRTPRAAADPGGAASARTLRDWQFGFGLVRHARLRPVSHAFSYRSFFLRIPGHQLDGARRGNWLFGVNRPALISFHESDHGDSGPLRPWIRELLTQAGVRADGEIWLHAFPRVLGYAFKPVSFWFCHDSNGQQRAIVAEVNNTFGERHCYLLAATDGAVIGQGVEMRAHKVFHVSPFCSVEGGYRFRFMNRGDRSVARIDYDDAQGPLLVTSISGTMSPVDPRNCARALAGYPAFTLGVIARIHWQALRLWLKRVGWHRKPQPPAAFTTRGTR